MTSPREVAKFHAEYDRNADDRVRLFQAIEEAVPPTTRVLYPGSYIDIAPSVWFDDVAYVDTDKRAARFFGETEAVANLIATKRQSAGALPNSPTTTFHHLDYREPLPIETSSVDLLVSLYSGFISEHCADLLVPGGTLLVNPSHGDAAMASIDPRYRLSQIVIAHGDEYRIDNTDLDSYLIPKKPQPITIDSLHKSGRGIDYTRSPFAYLFTKAK